MPKKEKSRFIGKRVALIDADRTLCEGIFEGLYDDPLMLSRYIIITLDNGERYNIELTEEGINILEKKPVSTSKKLV